MFGQRFTTFPANPELELINCAYSGPINDSAHQKSMCFNGMEFTP